ncbi:uncharacterized protein LOC129719933 [Wyeomyia smithii]|uniref:uncharacterized protein LOC129719933 n=1 Tax=Wyeomyia smithii TaxID=174621 RepID=UPI002467FC8D|nr:uncharacterized protein LOC129719933 [Wyeomyia smithii]
MVSECRQPHIGQQRGNFGPGLHPTQRITHTQVSEEDEDVNNLTRNQVAARQAVSRELPLFSGTPEEWPLFFSTFTTTTNLCGYTPEKNLIRLQKCLKGKAYETVKCRLMHPSNVSEIISTLKMLFGNPEVIVQDLITKIHSTPAPKADQLDTIIEFSLAVQNLCAVIDACQLEEYLYNVALLHELVDKLPATFKVEWARHRRSLPRVHLAAFSEWLYNLAEIVCPIASLKFSETRLARNSKKNSAFLNAHNQETSNDPVGKPRQHVTERFVVAAKTCVVCKKTCPNLEKCKQFEELGYNARWATVKELSLCRKCLRKHTGTCKSKQVCEKNGCTFKHHQLLHNVQRDGAAASSSNAPGKNSATVAQNTSVRECNTHHKSANKGLFRVAPVVIHGPMGLPKTISLKRPKKCSPKTLN